MALPRCSRQAKLGHGRHASVQADWHIENDDSRKTGSSELHSQAVMDL